MGCFPFFIDIENKSCVVVGGGELALRKLEALLPYNPRLKVVAPEICEQIYCLPKTEIRKKFFEDCDIDGAFAVIAATNDRSLNSRIFRLCTERNILINSVDDIKNCGFIFPALINGKNITVAISTGGKSPLYARILRERIEPLLDDGDRAVEILSNYRELIKREISLPYNRKLAFEKILEISSRGESVDEKQILKIIEDLK